jgi:ABC-2 type transport system permease protein
MGKLWVITAREFLERVRTKWFFIGTALGPVLFGAMMILPGWMQSRAQASPEVARIIILDATGVELGQRIAGALGGVTDTAGTEVREVNPAELAAAESLATTAVVQRERQGYLVIDSATIGGLRARYAGRNASAVSDMETLQRHVRDQVMGMRLEREGVSASIAASVVSSRLRLETERLTERGRGGSGMVNAFLGFGVAFLLYIAIFLYGQNVLRGVMEEKQTRVAEVVVSSVPPSRLLAGKVLGVGAVGLTQMLIWVVAGYTLVQLRGPILSSVGVQAADMPLPAMPVDALLLLLLFFLLGYVFYAAMFAAVGAMVNSEQEAQQALQPVMLLLVFSIIFVMPVMMNPTSTMAIALSIIPFSAPIIMPLRLTVTPVPPLELVASLLSLGVGTLATVWLASRIYRVGLLMYGKRPTLRELGRWIRYAG